MGIASTASLFRPQKHALALEPRILFDAAAAVAADHQNDSAHAATQDHDAAVQPQSPVEGAREPARQLVVLDSHLENREQLLADLPQGTHVLIVDSNQDAVAAISTALKQIGNVDSIQVFSHGSAGEFVLGRTTFTAESVRDMSSAIGAWRGNLSEGADIQLYGCNVGAGASGRDLVDQLARTTGADVGASDDNTGSASHGGDWTLEVVSGDIDKSLALSSAALDGFDGLLAATVSLSSGGTDVAIGGQFTFTVNFSNPAPPIGFGPFVDLFIPATGRDGDDGVTFVSASYLGNTIKSFVSTFDAAGNATHPLAVDMTGAPVVLNAATFGMRPGDQFVVLQLPFSSVSPDQPTIAIQVTATLSELADTQYSDGAADLTINARGGFQFGNDALNNPDTDPSLFEGALHPFVVHPTLVTLQQSIDMTEGETSTGKNFPHTQTVTVTPAAGQSLTNVVITQPLPTAVQVTSIVPGSGGTLTSITLHDGSVITGAVEIQAAIASDIIFLDSYTIEYATLTGPTTTQVGFYVPESDADGLPVLDPVSGADRTITFAPPTATGSWTPLDPRDVTPPNTQIDFSGTGTGAGGSFTASSITLHKEVSLQVDLGHTGVTPGDTLQYTLNLQISDYFAFGENLLRQGQFTIVDQLSDGQTLIGTPTLSINVGGNLRTLALVNTAVVNPDGTTTITFDVARSIRDATTTEGALPGDLAFDDDLTAATVAVIAYSTLVSQQYSGSYPQSDINEGDTVSNSATVTATVAEDRINLTGGVVSDQSSTTTTIEPNNVDIDITMVNGAAPPANGELRPGDLVTFTLAYDLVTGDFEQFSLSANLPLPVLDVSSIAWTQGTGAGQWTFGSGNTAAVTTVAVSSAAGNAVVFDFGDLAEATSQRIEVQFTLRVSDVPFADQRTVAVVAQSSQVTTIGNAPIVSTDAVAIQSIAEPLLAMRHGVVAASHGAVTGTTGAWSAPGTSGVPFTGSITDLAAIEGSVTGIDAGDVVRLATAIENSGGGAAYDVTTSITLPPGLSFVGGSLSAANLQIYRGDGTALVAGVDYSVSGTAITFLDAGSIGSLLPGRAGTGLDANGTNVVVITYDATVDNAIAAARTLQSTATLSNYASVDGGADFTAVDLRDTADQQVASPEIRKNFAGGSLDDGDSSAPHTTGSTLVVGERMLYDVIVTLPEGTSQTFRVEDLIPAGMRLDTSFNGGAGYQVITSAAGSTALNADFGGTVTAGAFAGLSGTPGDDGVGFSLAFSAASALADNNVANNTFVIRLQLIAGNVAANQANVSRQNSARALFSDPDGDTANGSTAIDRTVSLAGGAPTVTIQEPTLQITQTVVTTGRPVGVDEGDSVEYTIVIANGTAGSDIDAFDLSFIDTLPGELANLSLVSVTYAGGATHNGGADFELVGGQLRTVGGANIDIARGGSITLRVSGTVTGSAVGQPGFDNVASVQWTSLNGVDPAERTGVDGNLNSGVLNDYRRSATATVTVAQTTLISRIGGLPDTPAPATTDADRETVTIGEVIRYRVVTLIPEGSTSDYSIQVTLQNGLGFINDGTTRIAFLSDGGLTTDVGNLITGGVLAVVGDENSPLANPIAADLSGAAPTGVLNASQIVVTTDGNGNTVLTFNLGSLLNSESDQNLEGISLEFNVRVLNLTSNVAGMSLSASALDRSGSQQLSDSRTLNEDIVEPSFGGIDKRIISFDPNPTGARGSATVAVAFAQNGGIAAFDTRLTDSFPGGTGYSIVSVEIGGTVYGPGNLPSGVTAGTTSGVTVDFAQLAPGTAVRVVYEVSLPNSATVAVSNATLTWSSLPETFTSWGGSAVGTDGASGGERIGTGPAPNTYILTEGAGLGVISGTLWDDTASATASATPDGPALAGQTVTLTWAGADGNLDTTADNLQFSTTTDASGQYRFGVLPAGVFRIDTPTGTISYPQPIGDLRVRIDTDGSTLGQVGITLGEAATGTANAGYVQLNDAPVNTLPGTQSAVEDTQLAIAGLSVADIDAAGGVLDITLSVLHGTLSLSSTPGGVTATGAGTATLQLSGTLTALNQALANLLYLGNGNFNGSDTLTVRTVDRGGFGDADGDGIPGENPQDALADQDTLQINVAAVNDDPVANNDMAAAREAGGTANAAAGVNPRGDVLGNDTDVDIATNGDVLRVISAGLAGGSQGALPSVGTRSFVGQYGTLTLATSGAYEYVVDNANPDVQALRLSGQTLTEAFDYTMADVAGVQRTATLTVTISGANDAPVGVNDEGVADEAGGIANGSGGNDATGDVLANDTDVDTVANGESRSVTGIRALRETVSGDLVAVTAGTTSADGAVIAGTYGTLTIGADGTYRYVVDNTNTSVQRLVPGDQLNEYFSYQVTDAAGLSDLAELHIVIRGTQDNPVASDDAASAQVGAGGNAANENNPTGNVILFPSRTGTVDQPGGNGVDTDVDRTDRPNTLLTVRGVRAGNEGAGGSLIAVAGGTSQANGTSLAGTFGELRIGADGSFFYDVDSTDPVLQALLPGETRIDEFTYEIVDASGLTDTATLTITIRGVNDPPLAQLDVVLAVEAGGIDNQSPGTDPGGNVLDQDVDPDGDPLSAVAIRTGPSAGTGTAGTIGEALDGSYGALTLNADGTYTYVVNNANAAVQALREPGDLLIDRFTYTIADPNGESDSAEIVVVISGRNDTPVAVDDAATAVESGGVNNNRPGQAASGNVLGNDTDVDLNDETEVVSSVRTGTEDGTGTTGVVGSELRGAYGWLTLNADGSFNYRVDETLADVQALRGISDTLTDYFSYTVADALLAEDRATLTITITGANDAPVAVNDTARAVEASGLNNRIPGVDPVGNVLDNDSDVDAFGESLAVVGVRQGARFAAAGTAFAGAYGTLTLNADGSFTYVVDNDNPVVEALRLSTDTLDEQFTYAVRDQDGATRFATLTVEIHGRNDTPIAHNVTRFAVEAGGTANATPGVDPAGNLLDNDSDVDGGDTRLVAGVGPGGLNSGTDLDDVNGPVAVAGTYGTLLLNVNGTFTYVVNNGSAIVQALRPGDVVVDTFTYRMRDAAGDTSLAQLDVVVRGAWDAPVAQDNLNYAVAQNASNTGRDPSGNVLPNDSDVDRDDVLRLSGIRTGDEAAGGTLNPVNSDTDASNGALLSGTYGELIIGADGSYIYRVNSLHPVIQALGPLQFVTERFTYEVTDLGGGTDLAQLTILIRGRNEAPVVVADTGDAVEAGGNANAVPGVDPTGNVLANDSDIEADILNVTAIRTGELAGTGTAGTVGTVLRGGFGALTLAADGTWQYAVDNLLPEVQALRISGQTVVDIFTYTVTDFWGAESSTELRITIDGRNDTPVAVDDAATGIEAGGVNNGTAGSDAVGNVIDNDSDVDSAANGELLRVIDVTSEAGVTAGAGVVLAGRYGQLTVNADGSYRYVIDNDNPTVQALRLAGETLTEVFTYRISDVAGEMAQARLTITLQGANDAPIAANDSSVASDQFVAPETSGTVLPNDSDIDGGDQLRVVGIRVGAEAGSGAVGAVGVPLIGRYGTLIMNADGSYTYSIDLTNPEVLAAAGLGQILHDVFTYTVADLAGATDQAELDIVLDISAPYIPPSEGSGAHWDRAFRDADRNRVTLGFEPVVFITPIVRRDALLNAISAREVDGSDLYWTFDRGIRSESLGAGLGEVHGQYVHEAVTDSRLRSDLDMAWILGRHGRTSLSVDGLLPDPSVFAVGREGLLPAAAAAGTESTARAAPAFSAQLQAAAQRLRPDVASGR